jgi:hypothetical protein
MREVSRFQHESLFIKHLLLMIEFLSGVNLAGNTKAVRVSAGLTDFEADELFGVDGSYGKGTEK